MINQEFLNLLKKEGLAQTPAQRARGLFFGFLITFREDFPELENYLLDDEEHRAVFPYDQFQIYQMKLCTTNPDTLKLELKVPLLGSVKTGEFETFLSQLGYFHVNSKGHLNNQRDFSIFDKDPSVDKDAYSYIKQVLGNDFDLITVCKVISNYYESTLYATKLASYLKGASFIQDYKMSNL